MKYISTILLSYLILQTGSILMAREVNSTPSGFDNAPDVDPSAKTAQDTTIVPQKTNNLTDDIFQLIQSSVFRDTTAIVRGMNHKIEFGESRYLGYTGARIANIYVKGVESFGNSIYDTLSRSMTGLEKFGNSLHINTKERIIRENLLVAVGDTVEPFRLADNERILRLLPFIHEARIVIIPGDDAHEVDLLVITRDVFSIGVSFNPRSAEDVSVSLYDRNLLGNGWNLRNDFRYRTAVDPKLSYRGAFLVENIRGSFISSAVFYQTSHEEEKGQISFLKRFLTPEIKYGGGVDLSRTFMNDQADNYKTLLYTSTVQDYWVGRSIQLGGIESRQSLKLGLRYRKVDYDNRPSVKADSNHVYHNGELYLANLLFTQVKYFTSSMIKGFGSAEDIQVGYFLEFTGGINNTEFQKRYYMGGDLRLGDWIDEFGYLGFLSQIGGFLNGGEWEDGLFKVGGRYFSPLTGSDKFHFRHFLSFAYTNGINRKNDEKIDISDGYGIRGLSHSELKGSESITLNYESSIFSPWSIIGFQFAFFDFVDVGWVGEARRFPKENKFFSAMGFGCRIRNESLVLQTLNLRLAYYPKTPESNNHFRFEISTVDPMLFRPFKGGKPSLIPFE
ncbi:MAG: hypothetical protein E4H13_02045 [Calditrichales bacterium]|nr:MAG: hypothetical protein E4H13_02045 [Calditrichales bacterium]